MIEKATGDLWWKNAVVYCVDVATFLDSDGDGIGDLRGPDRARRLPRRPRRDVPVADAVLPDRPHATTATTSPTSTASTAGFGTLGDFVELVRTAADRGIRVIADFVRQPHSDDTRGSSPRAQRATRRYRDFYVWARPSPPEKPERRRVPGPGDSPSGPRTRKAGPVVPAPLLLAPARPQRRQPGGPRRDRAGDRLLARAGPRRLPRRRGAVPARADGMPEGALHDPHEFLQRAAPLHRAAGAATRSCSARSTWRRRRSATFFGDEDGDELHMPFDFIVIQVMYLALARGDAGAARRGAAGAAGHPRATASGRRSPATTTS